jgi:hypothetical protein
LPIVNGLLAGGAGPYRASVVVENAAVTVVVVGCWLSVMVADAKPMEFVTAVVRLRPDGERDRPVRDRLVPFVP